MISNEDLKKLNDEFKAAAEKFEGLHSLGQTGDTVIIRVDAIPLKNVVELVQHMKIVRDEIFGLESHQISVEINIWANYMKIECNCFIQPQQCSIEDEVKAIIERLKAAP